MHTVTANGTWNLVLKRIASGLLLLGVLMWTLISPAQVDRGSISGTVTETTGGVLRGAKVTVRNLGTGLLPLPNLPGLVNNYLSNPKNMTNGNQFDARVDNQVSPSDQLFVHGALQNVDFLKAAPLGSAGGCCQGFGSNINGREQSYAAGWTHVFATNLLNDARIA